MRAIYFSSNENKGERVYQLSENLVVSFWNYHTSMLNFIVITIKNSSPDPSIFRHFLRKYKWSSLDLRRFFFLDSDGSFISARANAKNWLEGSEGVPHSCFVSSQSLLAFKPSSHSPLSFSEFRRKNSLRVFCFERQIKWRALYPSINSSLH